MLLIIENIALRSLRMLYVLVLSTEKSTTFEAKVVGIKIYKYIQNSQTSQGYIFNILQHFATKPCNFANFKMLFSAVVRDFVYFAWFKT